MREVSPGDIIFSFVDTRIAAIGIARSYCWESPKPQEFGSAGQNWEDIGWKVRVEFVPLNNRIRPKDHIEVLRPLLPERYSPLQANGNGIQSVYLTEVPQVFAEVLTGLIGDEVKQFMRPADIADAEQDMRQSATILIRGSTTSRPRLKRTAQFEIPKRRPSSEHGAGRAIQGARFGH
jgi:putative restriction endonuclease